MPSSDGVFASWHGVVDHDFFKTLSETFDLPENDPFLYRAESFAMTLSQIKQQPELKYKYQSHGQAIEVPSADVAAYTSLFSSTTDASKALTSFSLNARKGSPRETIANYLKSRRICELKIPKSKIHINPYLDLWALSCHLTSFLGPLPDPSYAHPANAKRTHPILPVFYHHFGCVAPTYEALYIISQLGREVIDMASGNGYWTYVLRQVNLNVIAVDSMASEYRTMWISDTVKSDGEEYLKKNGGGTGKVLLMVYPVTAGIFTKRVLQAYKGNTIVIVGTQNTNRYTGFSDCTVEEWFEKEKPSWKMVYRIAMPSFAGKDEGLFVWRKK